MDIEEGTKKCSFSLLQHLLQLSYSTNPQDQQKAAVDLAQLVDGTAVFPAVSFGPLAHALCRLVPSSNRTVTSYSAKALKLLILDDALRPQALVAGVPAVVCGAIKQWEDEILCLRELLGALQTLSMDKMCVKGVLQADIIPHLMDFVKSTDQEVSVLSLATLANILTFSDTLLLSDTATVETLGMGIQVLVETLRTGAGVPDLGGRGYSSSEDHKPQRLYAAAAMANASFHPQLASILNQHGALVLCREIERQSMMNMNLLHLMGSKLGECVQTAVYRLSGRTEGNPKMGNNKYSFKWGTKPVMELSLTPTGKHGAFLSACFLVWVFVLVFTFLPLLFA